MGKEIRAQLRREALAARDALDPVRRAEWSAQILTQVCAAQVYHQARQILLYYSIRSEVETHRLLRTAISDGKEVYLPRITDRTAGKMVFLRVEDDIDLVPGDMGIPAPKPEAPLYRGSDGDGQDSCIALVPGLLFDEAGYRLGYGGGYYDRFLSAHAEVVPFGLAFAEQISAQPLEQWMEPTDVRMKSVFRAGGVNRK
ncbi:MAG: 5-formyltetrahydrofolate cyclo-ligase [Butyrivibrio sp.]|nr:5-formyltetrahydrofolate cyclo-ligase [Butyrivibrio sp.]